MGAIFPVLEADPVHTHSVGKVHRWHSRLLRVVQSLSWAGQQQLQDQPAIPHQPGVLVWITMPSWAAHAQEAKVFPTVILTVQRRQHRRWTVRSDSKVGISISALRITESTLGSSVTLPDGHRSSYIP